MMKKYDILFIGGGPAGYSCAAILGSKGKKVAVIEQKELGGTCVNEGCIPTKTLLKSAKLFNDIKDCQKYGFKISNLDVDYKITQQIRKNNKTKLNNAIAAALAEANVDVYKSEANVLSAHKVKVGDLVLETDKLILATGSKSRQIQFTGLEKAISEKKVYLTSTDFLVEENLPNSLLIYGGGPVALEFAYVASSFGTNVTILEHAPRLLNKMDEIAGNEVTKLLESKNIKIITNVQLESYEGNGVFQYKKHDGKLIKEKHDKLLLAVGRVANTKAFENLKINKTDNGFVKIDSNMKTSLNDVYAIGDVTGELMLTSTAYKHGDVLIETLLNKKVENFTTKIVAWALYFAPELAGVGLDENNAISKYGKDNVLAITIPAGKLPRNHADSKTELGFFKLIVEKTTGKILGSLIMLENASLIINEIALAISANLTIKDLQAVGHTHPTLSEAIYYASRGLGISLR